MTKGEIEAIIDDNSHVSLVGAALARHQETLASRMASMLRRLEWSTQRLSPGTVIPYPACPVCYAPARTHLPACALAALLEDFP